MGRPALLPPHAATGGARMPDMVRVDAACNSVPDPDIFFDDDTTAALAVCAACPVREACLANARANEDYGVWGGTTAEERREMRGGPRFITPEQRREADRIREIISRGQPQEAFAAERGINVRTINRWLLDERQPAKGVKVA